VGLLAKSVFLSTLAVLKPNKDEFIQSQNKFSSFSFMLGAKVMKADVYKDKREFEFNEPETKAKQVSLLLSQFPATIDVPSP